MNSDYHRLPEQEANVWIIDNLDMKSVCSKMLKQDNDCLLITTSVQEEGTLKKKSNPMAKAIVLIYASP